MSGSEQKRGWLSRGLRLLATLVLLALAALTVIRLSGWKAEVFPLPSVLAFTAYGVAAGGLLVIIFLLWRRWWHALAAAACTLALLGIVDPRTRPAGTPADPRDGGPAQLYGEQDDHVAANEAVGGPRLRITSLNTLWGHADFAQLTRLTERHQSDIVALQEIDAVGWARLKRSPLVRRYPHLVAGGGRSNEAVLARRPVRELDLGLPGTYRAASVSIAGGKAVTVISAHPLPPVTAAEQRKWVLRLAALPAPQRISGGRVIVAGDFNATVDHAQFRSILDRGWDDAALRTGAGLRPTWHGLPMLRLTIDHILVPRSFGVTNYRVDQIAGSDHRALTATIRLPN